MGEGRGVTPGTRLGSECGLGWSVARGSTCTSSPGTNCLKLPPAVGGSLLLFLFASTQHDSPPAEGAQGSLGSWSKETHAAEPLINQGIWSPPFAATGPPLHTKGSFWAPHGPPAHSCSLNAQMGPASSSPLEEAGAGTGGRQSRHRPSRGFWAGLAAILTLPLPSCDTDLGQAM